MRQHEADWRSDAACQHEDPEVFFATGKGAPAARQVTKAKSVCARCPVRDECRDYANTVNGLEGVFGGLLYPDEHPLKQQKPPVPKEAPPRLHNRWLFGGPPADQVTVERLVAGKPVASYTFRERDAAAAAMLAQGDGFQAVMTRLKMNANMVKVLADQIRVVNA